MLSLRGSLGTASAVALVGAAALTGTSGTAASRPYTPGAYTPSAANLSGLQFTFKATIRRGPSLDRICGRKAHYARSRKHRITTLRESAAGWKALPLPKNSGTGHRNGLHPLFIDGTKRWGRVLITLGVQRPEIDGADPAQPTNLQLSVPSRREGCKPMRLAVGATYRKTAPWTAGGAVGSGKASVAIKRTGRSTYMATVRLRSAPAATSSTGRVRPSESS